MNNTQVGRTGVRFDQASRAKKLGNLLAFIVIDPASQRFDGKSFHERRSVKLIEELIAAANVILDASRGRVKVADCEVRQIWSTNLDSGTIRQAAKVDATLD